MTNLKPILFSTPMVQAILRGTKSQTRRIVKPQPEINHESGYVFDGKYKRQYDLHNWREFFIEDWSKYQVNDILWVRETWHPKRHSFPIGEHFEYKATAAEYGQPTDEPWKPSIFMPKEAARIFLKVTYVRVERLNDMSYEDAFAEGIPEDKSEHLKWNRLYPDYLKRRPGVLSACLTPKSSYRSLWDSINGEGSFDKNPWVWVYEFERIEKP